MKFVTENRDSDRLQNFISDDWGLDVRSMESEECVCYCSAQIVDTECREEREVSGDVKRLQALVLSRVGL